jgi:hypothetical protein
MVLVAGWGDLFFPPNTLAPVLRFLRDTPYVVYDIHMTFVSGTNQNSEKLFGLSSWVPEGGNTVDDCYLSRAKIKCATCRHPPLHLSAEERHRFY